MSSGIQDPCGFDRIPDTHAVFFSRTPEALRLKAEAQQVRLAVMEVWHAHHPPVARHRTDCRPECACVPVHVLDAWEQAEEEDRRRIAEREARLKLRALWVSDAEIPERVMRTLEKQRESTEAGRLAEQYVAGDATFLVLTGGLGTGKTTAAAAALMRLAKPATGMFVQASRCGQLGLFADEDRLLLDNMKRVTCLVLDDLGTEFLSENSVWRGLVDGLLDARYAGMKRTIITTNLDMPAFAERYGHRVADRLRQDMVLGRCGSKSMRRPRGAP